MTNSFVCKVFVNDIVIGVLKKIIDDSEILRYFFKNIIKRRIFYNHIFLVRMIQTGQEQTKMEDKSQKSRWERHISASQ